MKLSEVVALKHTGVSNLVNAIDQGAYAVIKEHVPTRRAGWIYCKAVSQDIPVCKVDGCRFYPCEVNP